MEKSFEPGAWRKEKPVPAGPREEQLRLLRARIQKAERASNEQEVLMLEAELHAAEEGKEFDRDAYMANRFRKTKHQALREMQNLKGANEDMWAWDGVYKFDTRNYNETFEKLLDKLNVESIGELVHNRAAALKRPLNVLDLFGGAYFLHDLTDVNKIIGVRLRNVDQELQKDLEEQHALAQVELNALANDPRREILEGNLYNASTWNKLAEKLDTDGKGFDLITCRPQGPFGHTVGQGTETILNVEETHSSSREEIFAILLEKALNLLSPDGGILLTQTPDLGTDFKTLNEFWASYTAKKKTEGYDFFFEAGTPFDGDSVAVVRRKLESPES